MDRGLLDNLKDILQERISFSESVRNNHAKGEDAYDPVLPRAVLFPNNNEELSKILKICNEFKVPVTAYGTGTSLEGHVVGMMKDLQFQWKILIKLFLLMRQTLIVECKQMYLENN